MYNETTWKMNTSMADMLLEMGADEYVVGDMITGERFNYGNTYSQIFMLANDWSGMCIESILIDKKCAYIYMYLH